MKRLMAVLISTILIAACQKSSSPEQPESIKPVRDIDGNGYDTIKIGTQIWLKQNLKTSHYRNGDPIPQVSDFPTWASLTTGAWCWYSNDSISYNATYGKLYNWYTVHDPRGIAPVGYHIPTNADWDILENFLGGLTGGGALKDTGTAFWLTPNTGATNSSRFTGLPGGYRDGSNGAFVFMRFLGGWWSSTDYDAFNAWYCNLDHISALVSRYTYVKKDGFSVRCIKD
jgi:uncharacterized protein (TIGR02145 family)